ncbi:MAG: DegT/DnrJ/EryC1/StrS family aminotransferase [Deltaproteobacteria bacterium]|nr:DegT/DnrJ/EryC1/StrS family aminotransferase [Deltaproteobacteria bacterium]
MIPMVDLQRQYKTLKAEIDAAIQNVLDSAQFILGPNVSALEKEIAAYHGIPYAVGVASGTDALLLALRACGIREGDEVITSPFTFIATADVIALLHATPVFVDIEPETFNMDPGKIEEKITAHTKAIIPVHLFGHPADMNPIVDLARRYNLKIVEDCAQAFGATYHGKKVGTMGDFGCFSFFPSKNLAGYGDGGMIVTKHSEMAERIKLLRNHGSAVKYHHTILGYNSRLDEIQAAVIRTKMQHIDIFNRKRRENADLYRRHIERDDINLPVEKAGCMHVYHQFTIRSKKRDGIMAALTKNDISSAIYYPVPLHRQEVFSHRNIDEDNLKISEMCAGEVLSLPMFPELESEEIRFISDVLNNAH